MRRAILSFVAILLLLGPALPAATSAQASPLSPDALTADPRLCVAEVAGEDSGSLDGMREERPEEVSRSFIGTVGAAGLGALVGGLVGLRLGDAAAGYAERQEDSFLLGGLVFGSWAGGWYGGRSVGEPSGRTALGSALGVAAGGLAFQAANRSGSSMTATVAFGLAHGLMTALINAPR